MANIPGRESEHDSSKLRSGLSRKRTYQDICKSISGSVKKIAKKSKVDNESTDSKSTESTFKYGNYNRYYGYRNENKQEDERLTVLKKEWFEEKSVLDIGSNVGHITLWIGKKFNPVKIKGVDIDCDLVKCAKRNIVHYIDENYVSEMEKSLHNDKTVVNTDISKGSGEFPTVKEDSEGNVAESVDKDVPDVKKNLEVPLLIPEGKSASQKEETASEKSAYPEESSASTEEKTLGKLEPPMEKDKADVSPTTEHEDVENQSAIANQKNENQTDEEKGFEKRKEIGKGLLARLEKNSNAVKENAFPYNVSFILENYVPGGSGVLKYVKEEYHTILCLSVTKWIQLNFGDSGLKLMFQKIYKQLHPGGRLILEPQPYKSYKRRKNLTPAIRRNYDDMKLMPDQFIEYLLSSEVGFSKSEQIDITLHEKQGFQRPMYLLTK